MTNKAKLWSINLSQEKAFNEIAYFIKQKLNTRMVLSGSPGTGKSFLTATLVEEATRLLASNDRLTRLAVCATTNKAAAILSDEISNTVYTAQTIYSYLGLRVKSNFNNGTESLVAIPNKAVVKENTLILIDEASMVSTALFGFLDTLVSKSCKIVFIGDKYQLPPVKEKESIIYRQGYKETFLTTPMRNNESKPLMDLCEQLKETVMSGVFKPIKEHPGVIDFVDGPTALGIMQRGFGKSKLNGLERVLCYTNKKTSEYGEYISKKIMGNTESYAVGSTMIIANPGTAYDAESHKVYKTYVDQEVMITKVESSLGYSVENTQIGGSIITAVCKRSGKGIRLYCMEDPLNYGITLKHYAKNKNWEKYFYIKEVATDLRNLESSTVHKSQGSTYEEVFIDLKDLSSCTDETVTARLLYVAVSRAKSRVYIKGELAPRYFK